MVQFWKNLLDSPRLKQAWALIVSALLAVLAAVQFAPPQTLGYPQSPQTFSDITVTRDATISGRLTVVELVSSTLSYGVGNGTAAAPTLFFTSDPNTGLYRVGADQIAITAGGVKTLDCNAVTCTVYLPMNTTLGLTAPTGVTVTGVITLSQSGAITANSSVTAVGLVSTNGLTVTGATSLPAVTASGAVSAVGLSSTNGLTVTGAVSLPAVSTSGLASVVGLNSTNGLTVTGAVSLPAISTSGLASVVGLNSTNGLTVTGATALPAFSASGLASVVGVASSNGITSTTNVLSVGGATFTGPIKYGTAASYTQSASITHGFSVTPTVCFINPVQNITTTYTITATGFSSDMDTTANPIYWMCGK